MTGKIHVLRKKHVIEKKHLTEKYNWQKKACDRKKTIWQKKTCDRKKNMWQSLCLGWVRWAFGLVGWLLVRCCEWWLYCMVVVITATAGCDNCWRDPNHFIGTEVDFVPSESLHKKPNWKYCRSWRRQFSFLYFSEIVLISWIAKKPANFVKFKDIFFLAKCQTVFNPNYLF